VHIATVFAQLEDLTEAFIAAFFLAGKGTWSEKLLVLHCSHLHSVVFVDLAQTGHGKLLAGVITHELNAAGTETEVSLTRQGVWVDQVSDVCLADVVGDELPLRRAVKRAGLGEQLELLVAI
jgi:hypothetical protein